MSNDLEKNYESWFKKAREDELSIEAILKESGHPNTACFLAQQMSEKYLKGLLVSADKNFPKMHDLIELETLLLEVFPDIKEMHENLKLLNRFYIETRYPGDFPEFSWQEANGAYSAAKKVKEFALGKINFSEKVK
jgi:HEPN domain-containing protein